MSSEKSASPEIVSNIQRRTLIKGAAWAAPVIAVAAAAPMAAASATSPSLVKYGTGAASINPNNPTVGEPVEVRVYNNAFNLVNITGEWNTGVVSLTVTSLTGLNDTQYKSESGSVLSVGSTLTASNGVDWKVISLSPFQITSPGVTVSSATPTPFAIPAPTFAISGTYLSPGGVNTTLSTAAIPGNVYAGGSFGA